MKRYVEFSVQTEKWTKQKFYCKFLHKFLITLKLELLFNTLVYLDTILSSNPHAEDYSTVVYKQLYWLNNKVISV